MQVSFTLNEDLTVYGGGENKTVSAPREHPFTMQSVGGQTLAVFTETSSGKCDLRGSAPALTFLYVLSVLVTRYNLFWT